ncbi:MAG: NADPH-dependent F420 reductase [Dehalococcoidia bacterium]|nr:NADPH-dependent F420 reductase [Dehalococcoidia bacterium]
MEHQAAGGIIAIIGGTGAEGTGLAKRFIAAGNKVIIGSRSTEKALMVAEDLKRGLPHADVSGMENQEAAAAGSIIFITVPYDALKETAERLSGRVTGKVVVSTVVPMASSNLRTYSLPMDGGSAALELQQLLPDSMVVAAFQTVSAKDLLAPDRELACDVPVCSDHQGAKEIIMSLASCVNGVRPIDGGLLENSRYLEGITVFLLNINRIYGVRSGIRITGI